MLQRETAADLIPWCRQNNVALMAYWPLMKGLLAGQLARDHRFDPADPRLRYPIFQGKLWQANQDFLDEIRTVASSVGKTVAQVVVNWTFNFPGVTAALCGAKRPGQVRETAASIGWTLDRATLQRIESAYERWQEATSDPSVLGRPND
jgi:aryl-alcohol dehydrogenase-like predicted oxidoreductase